MPDDPSAMEEIWRDLDVLLADPGRVDRILDEIAAANGREAAIDVAFEAAGRLRALRVLGVLGDAPPGSKRAELVATSAHVGAWLDRIERSPRLREALGHVFPYSFFAVDRGVLWGLLMRESPMALAMLASDAGIDRARLDFTGPVSRVVRELLDEAVKEGRLHALAGVVAERYPAFSARLVGVSQRRGPADRETERPTLPRLSAVDQFIIVALVVALMSVACGYQWSRFRAAAAQAANTERSLGRTREELDHVRAERDRALRELAACTRERGDGAVGAADASFGDEVARPSPPR